MITEFLLEKLIHEYIHEPVTTKEIAQLVKANRHTISKLRNNTSNSISFKALGNICDWLIRNHVPPEILPGALFGTRPSNLWNAAAATGWVYIYLGEYLETQAPTAAPRWVSRRDAQVQSMIVSRLTGLSQGGQPPLHPETVYVPFRVKRRIQADKTTTTALQGDIKNAKRIFNKMQKNPGNTVILVGSQRVNYVLEHFVAHFFGRKPFTPQKNPGAKIPFYTQYRDCDHALESCFGGLGPPHGYKDEPSPGIYYRDKKDRWKLISWKQDEQCAGITITVYDPSTKGIQMAIFGFTGIGTENLGTLLVDDKVDDKINIWPPKTKWGSKKIAVHIYRIVSNRRRRNKDSGKSFNIRNFDAIAIEDTILQKYLRKTKFDRQVKKP